ncbi:AraC family transcriptional regulator [Pseudorhodoplanes sp.]|uniref:AraC family transcriptional regulator n=1 Tax=Pseudorhodoplanes sp. TaxID=1934341 RepID=UPI002C92E677|nr:AraC family transcriptional regulator [Pseudorhodoplanes sp.]HWV51695.1 AraC family transcriptional regulator [Pseudorhodoplanes sp.]
MLQGRTPKSPSPARDCASQAHATTRTVSQLEEAVLVRIVEFIDENFARPISIQELAALAEMSRYHFSRRFKRKTGVSPYVFLTIARMERARKLLLETGLSQEEIAEKVGISHVGHFRAQFRKHFGLNPSDIR